eukprot:3925745-Rhodomonas_salina.6
MSSTDLGYPLRMRSATRGTNVGSFRMPYAKSGTDAGISRYQIDAAESLCEAAAAGDTEALRRLLENRIDPNVVQKKALSASTM